MLDPALLRPGRFDRVIEIPLPDRDSRLEILKIHSSKLRLVGVSLEEIADITENSTGAEVQAICREAGMIAVRKEADEIVAEDFLAAVRKVRNESAFDDRMYT